MINIENKEIKSSNKSGIIFSIISICLYFIAGFFIRWQVSIGCPTGSSGECGLGWALIGSFVLLALTLFVAVSFSTLVFNLTKSLFSKSFSVIFFLITFIFVLYASYILLETRIFW